MSVPHKCPKCGGLGQLLYDPDAPLSNGTTNAGPWRCPPCYGSGILWSQPAVTVPSVWDEKHWPSSTITVST